MSIARVAARNGFWLVGFRLAGQLFSWMATVMIARVLMPEDYGMLSMATLLTGYIEVFSTMGLGVAIVQRKTVTADELSSNFWFCLMMGAVFAGSGALLAYPTAWIFGDPRLIPFTQTLSLVFIIGALAIVPLNLLNREVRFKEIGVVQLISVVVSSAAMLVMVHSGFGVWTLVFGIILLKTIDMALIFQVSKWRPTFHFQFREIRPFLKFGISFTGSGSLFYLLHALIHLIIGKMLGTQALGFYTLAAQLARLPNDKIMPIIKQISFPVLSQYQDDLINGRRMYLKMTKYIALMASPIFLGGAFLGDEIIPFLLGAKWVPIVFLFKALCLAQFIASLTEVNNLYHAAQGRPIWVVFFQAVNVLIIPLAIFVAAPFGLHAVVIPWITVFPLICTVWGWVTLRQAKLRLSDYFASFIPPFLVMLGLLGGVYMMKLGIQSSNFIQWNIQQVLIQEVVVLGVFYMLYLAFFEKESLREVRSLFPKFPSGQR